VPAAEADGPSGKGERPTAIRIWQVFPFALSSGWSIAVHALLVVAIAGSCIALVVQIVSLARWFTGHTPHGGHLRTGH